MKNLKETEANDWDLVDQWNKQQSEEQDDNSIDVASVANEFDRLLTNTTQVFETSTLLTKESKAFGNIYHNKALFTLEFRDEKFLSIILMMCQRRDLKLHGKN